MAIDLCSIRESIDSDHVRWVPTHIQLADYLTKIKSCAEIMSIIRAGVVRLTLLDDMKFSQKKESHECDFCRSPGRTSSMMQRWSKGPAAVRR